MSKKWTLTSEGRPTGSGHFEIVGRWTGYHPDMDYNGSSFGIESRLDDDVLCWRRVNKACPHCWDDE